ncbi:MAG: hypothetical protein FD123_3420 [Bacteroidetes bacterium]|nr:MAG: hypothetical protein FD123_3420 [Bacteroidota bacterium]
MKKYTLFFVFLFAGMLRVSATHNIAGEITLVCTGGYTYEALITTYTNSQSNADRCDLTLDWGDGTQTVLTRFGGNMTGCGCTSPVTCGFDLTPVGYPNTQRNTYKGSHTYSGPATYTLIMIDPNRIAGIDNIQNSVNTPFVIKTVLTVNPFIGCNSTPYFTTVPLDKACVNHCFYHNPGAVDPENDSLSYSIGAVLDTLGNPMTQPTLFAMPDAPCNTTTGFPHGGGGVMTIDPVTGDLSWCSPGCQGKFNVAVFVHEWKKIGNVPVEVSVVEREMEIDVATCNNNNPVIPNLPDLCVDAGTTLNFNFQVTDPDVADLIEITAYGTAVNATPPATVSPNATGVYNAQPVNVSFNWLTNCDNVRLQPYSVVIKARDNDPQVQLLDIESFNITVVSPGPQVLTAVPSGTSMNLNWSVNPCNPTYNPLIGYKIYRKTGPSGWVPAQCETGVPAYTGFIHIGTVTGVNSTSFIDNNGGAGLTPGVNYCYRVHAYFLDAAMSYASPEACNELRREVPVISHVDVVTTGISDIIGVSWFNPIGDTLNFDTIQNPGPYQLRIYRSPGPNMSISQGTLITTLTSNTFAALPDTFTDNGLVTVSQDYSYRIAFFANNGNDSIGSSHSASSVFLQAASSDNAVTLAWSENVPWTNFLFEIYRDDPGLPVLYSLVGTTAQHTYKDSNLVNGSTYCYYVRSLGSYFNPLLPDTLYNRSQQLCAVPQDLTPPCPPQLGVNSDCFNYNNQLQWINPMNLNCGTDDVVSYNIWYTPTEGGPWQLLATVGNAADTMFTQLGLTSVAGCYAVTALDTFNNQSAYSNIVCVDNCPEYILPNVFTPDADGTNDFFIPFPFRYIESIDLKIFDRWGVLIFETTDPAIKWNGRDMTTNKLCTDGVYYYICTVNEIRLEGIVPRQISGFFHLFSKDNSGPF